MRASTCLIAALLLTGTAANAHPDLAVKDTHRPAADVARDADRKPAAMLKFAKVDHGMKVVDFIAGGGYFTRLFAVAVKPGGSVVAIIPKQVADRDPKVVANMQSIVDEPAYADVTMAAGLGDPSVKGADVIWTAQNYHDLHNGPAETVVGANKAAFDALKPGGYYVVIDHRAAVGAPADVTKTLHRIDPAVVKAEVIAAGFVLDGESKALVNAGDDHTKTVFDPSIRSKTDQFALRFKKPK